MENLAPLEIPLGHYFYRGKHLFREELRVPSVTMNYILRKRIDFRNGEASLVGEYIFETFYEPIDNKSYDSEKDSHTDKQYEIWRKNEHSITPSSELN